MNYSKLYNVKSPNRGTARSAGIDFFVPENTEEFISKFTSKNPTIEITDTGFNVPAHARVNIPSGIRVHVPTGFALIAFNKSSVSLKYGLDVGACVVDEDYQGEVHLSLTNTSDKGVHIDFGQKIVQFILLPIFYDDVHEVYDKDLFAEESERGTGAFGSTGSK